MFGRNYGGDVAARAIVAGFATGLRSQSVFPVLANAARGGRFAVDSAPPLGWLRSETVGRLTTMSMIGEMVVDKLPIVPARIKPQPLGGRLGFGVLSGGIIAREAGRSWVEGALLGATGAFAGSYAGYWLRKRAVASSDLPDAAVALLEDAVALGLARSIV